MSLCFQYGSPRSAGKRAAALLGFALLPGLRADAAPGSVTTTEAGVPRRAAREIALTFDDAPRSAGGFFSADERAERLIAGLEKAGVDEAMFFVKTGGIRTPDDAERLRRYTRAGHRLANHSHSHGWLNRTDADEYIADIGEAARVLEGYDNVDRFYRFPFLDEGRTVAKRDAVREALDRLGLVHGYVTVDNYDWHLAGRAKSAKRDGLDVDLDALREVYLEHLLESVEFYDAIAREHLDRSPRHVLLLHENDLAALFVEDLVRALREAGWTIIGAREAYDDPIAVRLPDTLFNGQGRVAAIAHAAGALARSLVQASEDEAYLDDLLAERGVFVGATAP